MNGSITLCVSIHQLLDRFISKKFLDSLPAYRFTACRKNHHSGKAQNSEKTNYLLHDINDPFQSIIFLLA